MGAALSPEFILTTEGYRPNGAVAEQLSQRTIVPIIGPTAVGKSSLMDNVCQLDPEFRRVVSFTTRPQRPAEPNNTYRFLAHDANTIRDIESKARRGELVQVTVHPTTGYIYGTELTDYAGKYNLIDMLTTEMPNIRALPFGAERAIAIATEPAAWEKWFMERFAEHPETDDAIKRLKEAAICLEWSLADQDVLWFKNTPEQLGLSANQLTKLIRGEAESGKEAKSLAQTILTTSIPRLKQNLASN